MLHLERYLPGFTGMRLQRALHREEDARGWAEARQRRTFELELHGFLILQKRRELPLTRSPTWGCLPSQEPLCLWGGQGLGELSRRRSSTPAPRLAWPSAPCAPTLPLPLPPASSQPPSSLAALESSSKALSQARSLWISLF